MQYCVHIHRVQVLQGQRFFFAEQISVVANQWKLNLRGILAHICTYNILFSVEFFKILDRNIYPRNRKSVSLFCFSFLVMENHQNLIYEAFLHAYTYVLILEILDHNMYPRNINTVSIFTLRGILAHIHTIKGNFLKLLTYCKYKI